MKISSITLFGAIASANAFVPSGKVSRTTAAFMSSLDKPTTAEEANIAGTRTAFSGSYVASNEAAKATWKDTFDSLEPVRVQGGALKTWSFSDPDVERVFLSMTTEGPYEGNPLNAEVELNQGPNNTPQKMKIYSGKGRYRPFKMWIESPGDSCAVFIRNKSTIEFPIISGVGAETTEQAAVESGLVPVSNAIYDMSPEQLVQGAAVRSFDLEASVSSVKIVLKTDGRPLNATVELVQGPNAPKYTIDVYTEDGMLRPFSCIFETPGAGNVVRILNSAAMEFPLTASVGPSSEVP
jgi:hypothetical protein